MPLDTLLITMRRPDVAMSGWAVLLVASLLSVIALLLYRWIVLSHFARDMVDIITLRYKSKYLLTLHSNPRSQEDFDRAVSTSILKVNSFKVAFWGYELTCLKKLFLAKELLRRLPWLGSSETPRISYKMMDPEKLIRFYVHSQLRLLSVFGGVGLLLYPLSYPCYIAFHYIVYTSIPFIFVKVPGFTYSKIVRAWNNYCWNSYCIKFRGYSRKVK